MKASDNPFTSILITEGSEPTAPASGKQRLYVDSADHHLKITNSSGTETDLQAAASATILGVTCYYPAVAVDISITSSTLVDVDATNMAVTFTAPASGNVLVHVGVACKKGTGYIGLGLREGTTIIGQLIVGTTDTIIDRATELFYITGISAGSHTYKLAALQAGGGTGHIYADQVGDGPVMMVVYAAP